MSIPIVTIIGRPNVGKSTLFNRIIKRREAIVDDKPGVTRDRLYSEAEWNGVEFMLVDTGGYLPQTFNELEIAIREQVDIAITETDLILFVVDRASGITDWDFQIAQKLVKTEKPVLLVVNKVDNENMESDIYNFYNLGVGEPNGISAIHGRAIGDLLDKLTNQFKLISEKPIPLDSIKLAVIGRENVGKSSFVNTLLEKTRSIVTSIPGTTRDPIDSFLTYNHQKYTLIDTAGLKRRAKVKENILFYSQLRTLKSIQRADIVLYFMDAQDGPTRQDLRTLQDVIQHKKGTVIAMNKWDLIAKNHKTLDVWQSALKERLGEYNYIPILFISVIHKQRLYKLLDLATTVYFESQKYIQTSELNEKLLPIIKQTHPPATQGKEIKIKYITQVKNNPPVIAFFCNYPQLITENYRRFLERKVRELWGFTGIPVTIVFKSKKKNSN